MHRRRSFSGNFRAWWTVNSSPLPPVSNRHLVDSGICLPLPKSVVRPASRVNSAVPANQVMAGLGAAKSVGVVLRVESGAAFGGVGRVFFSFLSQRS